MSVVASIPAPCGVETAAPPPVAPFPESLENLRFERCLDRSACGELWQVADDAGTFLAWLLQPGQPSELWNDFYRVQNLKQPGLAPLQVIAEAGNRPVLFYPFPPLTLLDRFNHLRKRALPGVPRDELLGYFHKLAALLDELHGQRHFHLALHPRWIFLSKDPDDNLSQEAEPLLAGLGFAQHAWLPTGRALPPAHGRYTAPELALNLVGPRCDQYSLALIYAEMQSGVFPLKPGARDKRSFNNPRETPFDFTCLGSGEARVLAQALDPEPARRFGSCRELVQALDDTLSPQTSLVDALELPPAHGSRTGQRFPGARSLDRFVADLVRLAVPGLAWDADRRIRYRLEPGGHLEHQVLLEAKTPDVSAGLRAFCRQWGAPFDAGRDGAVLLTLVTSSSFWQRLVGRRVGLQVEVLWERFPVSGASQGELRVLLRTFGCNGAEARRLLESKGPAVLDSLREHLHARAEQRAQVRVPFHRPVQVQPVVDSLHVGEPIDCVGKDISPGGIGFFLPSSVQAAQVVIRVEDAQLGEPAAGLAQIVRRQACGEGWFEVGARFGPG